MDHVDCGDKNGIDCIKTFTYVLIYLA